MLLTQLPLATLATRERVTGYGLVSMNTQVDVRPFFAIFLSVCVAAT